MASATDDIAVEFIGCWCKEEEEEDETEDGGRAEAESEAGGSWEGSNPKTPASGW